MHRGSNCSYCSAIYLSTASSVLRSPSCDQLGISVLDEVLKETHMLLLCKNGIVGFQTIFL